TDGERDIARSDSMRPRAMKPSGSGWFVRLSPSNQDRLDQLDNKRNRRLRRAFERLHTTNSRALATWAVALHLQSFWTAAGRQGSGDQKGQMLSGKEHQKEVASDSQSYSEDDCSVGEDIRLCLLTKAVLNSLLNEWRGRDSHEDGVCPVLDHCITLCGATYAQVGREWPPVD